jgi:hypothetical protein
MGCRGIILVKEDEESVGVSLYSHWGGACLTEVLQHVLERQARWDDVAYLTRMIFSEMIPAEDRSEETGYGIGIGNNYLDLDTTPIEVVISTQMVKCGHREWSFEEYIQIPEAEICAVDPINSPTIRDR